MDIQNLCLSCMNIKPDNNDKCPFCGFENSKYEIPDKHLPPMTPLHGKYILGKAIGQGGFGITYIAYDFHLETKVAIKELFLKQISDRSDREVIVEGNKQYIFEENKKRFLQEARVLARFNEKDNEGIVTVKEHFEENNTAYIVMEYLDGINLRDYIKNTGPVSIEKTIDMMGPVFHALDKVHQFGIIHKDISPDNIMILNDGRTKLLDFGGAQSVYTRDVDDIVSFKRGYAPPEQYQENGRIGKWTDVYALGATIYYCITQIKPVDARERQNGVKTIQKPSELGIKLSKNIEEAIMKALELDPMKRFENVDEFWNAINVKKKPSFLPKIIAVAAIAAVIGVGFNMFNKPEEGIVNQADSSNEEESETQNGTTGVTDDGVTEIENNDEEESEGLDFEQYEVGDIVPLDLGTYIFENAADPDHFIMGIDSNFGDDGAALIVKPYEDINCNRFYLEEGTNGAYLMHAAHTDSYIEPMEFENVASQVVQHRGNGANNYNFTFVFCGYNEEREEVEVMIQNADGFVLKPEEGGLEPGTRIVFGAKNFDEETCKWYVRWSEINTEEPKVEVRNEGDMVESMEGVHNLASAMDGITLWSVSSYSELDEPEIIVWEQVWDDTQRFRFELKEESRYRIYPLIQEEENTKCLEYDENLERLVIRDINEENANQLFRVIYAGYNMYLIQTHNEMVIGFELKSDGTWQGMPLKAKPYGDFEDSKMVKWLMPDAEE